MHLGDPDVGMLPAIAIVGGREHGRHRHRARVQAAARRHRSPSASSATARPTRARSTRGSTSPPCSGCPVVFVCENNLYGASTSFARRLARPRRRRRAPPRTASPAEIVDGMDVLAVREAGGRAVAAARAGEGPTLLECKTLPLRRPQPQRRARLPHARGGGGVAGARPDRRGCARELDRRRGRADRGRGRGRARGRGRVRPQLADPTPRSWRSMPTPEARHAAADASPRRSARRSPRRCAATSRCS